MTAIAGIVRFDGHAVERAVLERMKNLLAPYGRDAQHTRLHGQTGLLRTLLRTTPEDNLDQQPLHHGESDTCLLFDGRLDNRDELCRELGLPAAEAAPLADSALALRAILRWDTAAVSHFVGDFALACWNSRQRRLWLARDPLGHRPLFWHRQAGFFAFATLPKALFAVPGVPRALCEERLSDLLTLIPMVGPESLFKDIYRVEPGQLLLLEGDRLTTRRYHQFDPEREIHLPSDDDYLEAFREHLERAVASQLRANGPIASRLSSGFDSSTVTAVAARQLAGRGERLSAYTAAPREGFDGPAMRGCHADESPGARALAARFDNIDHILIRPGGTSPLEHLQTDIESLDRAPLNPCNQVWLDAIDAAAAQRGARVLLTGAMGNMSISYTGEPYLPALLGRGRLSRWWREAAALRRNQPGWRWRKLITQSVGPYLPPWLWTQLERRRGRSPELTDYSAIHPDFMARIGSRERARRAGWDLSYRPWADGRHMRVAVLNRVNNGEHQAAANLLGLEWRDPTADLRLLEFCLAVPDQQYLRNGETRWLLKRLMGNVLPREILQARTMGLQAADWYEGVGADLARVKEELRRLAGHPKVAEYLDLDTLQSDLEDWPAGGWASDHVVETYRLKLLRGLSVGGFIRYVEESNR